MKIKCENIVACGNYKCELNLNGACIHTVVALDACGKCVLFEPSDGLQTITHTIIKDAEGKVIEETESGFLI